jgi:osmotically-inducible protein OsmY
MKTWIAVSSVTALVATLLFSSASFAQDTAGSTVRSTTTSTTTTISDDDGSWQGAAQNATAATERAYNDVARSVKDMALEARIKAVLYENTATRDTDVHVLASNGIVTLTGQVPSPVEARRVQDVVANVYGVRGVNNHLYYPSRSEMVTPPDANSTGVAHPAYSNTAPAENAPVE